MAKTGSRVLPVKINRGYPAQGSRIVDENQPVPLSYAATPLPVDGRWPTWIAFALLGVQVIWIIPWALFQRGLFEDGLSKQPLFDFFVGNWGQSPISCSGEIAEIGVSHPFPVPGKSG